MQQSRTTLIVAFVLFLLIGAGGEHVASSAEDSDRAVKTLMLALFGGNIAVVELPSWRVSYAGERIARIAYPIGIRVFSKTDRAAAYFDGDTRLYLVMFNLKNGTTMNLRDCAGLSPKAKLWQAYIATSGDPVFVGLFSEQYTFWDFNSGSVSPDQMEKHSFRGILNLAMIGPGDVHWKKQKIKQLDYYRDDYQTFPTGLPSFGRLRQEILRGQAEDEKAIPNWKQIRRNLETRRKEIEDNLALKALLDSRGTPGTDDGILYWDATFVVCRHDDRLLLIAHDGEKPQVLGRSPADFGKQDSGLLSPGAVDIVVE